MILLTGATGFIGKNLLEGLKNKEVYCYKRGEDVFKVLDKVKPEVIIHCAAEIYDIEKMFASNIKLTYDLLIDSIKIPYRSFVYIGSSSEYGKKDQPMEEEDVLEPRNMYEATKGCGTLLCQAVAREFNKPISIVRPFSVYGPGEPRHRFIPTIIRKLKEGGTLKISPGNHDFIHIDDLVSGVELIINNNTYSPGEIYNFGSGQQCSNEELVERVERLAKKKIRKRLVGRLRPFDTNCWVADNSKAQLELGWKITKSLSEGLSELI